jgi:hypothetical protein
VSHNLALLLDKTYIKLFLWNILMDAASTATELDEFLAKNFA